MRRAVVVVGKAPVPGLTKTRLVPPLTEEQAAELYRGFLLDAVELGLGLGWERVSVIHPLGARAALQRVLPPDVHLLEQHGIGLGNALPYAIDQHFAEGFDRVFLLASDNPTLPTEPLNEACASLVDASDLAIGPTEDGGYYLLGLAAPHLGVFEEIEWSTPRVYAQTVARARQAGLRVHAVRAWFDVDEPADLERLQRELSFARRDMARHTRTALNSFALSITAH